MRSLLLAALLLLASSLLAHAAHGNTLQIDAESQLGSSGLRYRSPDGEFELNLTTAVQFRLTYHDTRGSNGSGGENGRDFINFRFPGVRTFITGHFFSEEFQYRLWLVWGWPDVAGVKVEDCYFRWAPDPLFNVTVGQMRVPASWEYLVDHERTGLPDRAIADEAFSQGWGKGVSISGRLGLYDTAFDEALLTWEVGVYNGVIASEDGAQGRGELQSSRTGSGVTVAVTDPKKTEHFDGGFRNSDWQLNAENFGQVVDGQLMVAARVEYHPMGELIRHMADLGSIEDTAAWFVMIGLGVNWMSARVDGTGSFLGATYASRTVNIFGTPIQPPSSGRKFIDAQILHITGDGHFRWIGLSINWAIHYRSVNFTPRGKMGEQNLAADQAIVHGLQDTGITVDAGYFVLRDELLISARFSTVNFDDFKSREATSGAQIDGDALGADSYEYGGGVTWFIRGDNLKLQADYRYIAQQLPFGTSHTNAFSGVERTSNWRVVHEYRVQLQWIF
jgi:hypothetical protein